MSEKELIEKDLSDLAQKQEEEQLRNLERYHFLKENGYILFETIVGSQAHGTNTPSSDVDKAFVYILPQEDILGMRYKEQLKIHKDFMGYEIKRFLELLQKGNPTILELLNTPADCLLIKHPAFDILLNSKDAFVTKACENAFYGYAKQQRAKAEGLEKLQNWEANRVTKKTPLDFCYAIEGYDAIPVRNWLEKRGLDQLFCALTAVNHCRDLFAVFYDYDAHNAFSALVATEEREYFKTEKKRRGESMGLGYKGIAFEDSNDIRLSNIPKEERDKSICNLSYNKDGYRKHCDDYNKYQKWLENRNETRWVEIKGHGQQIDGKNMMHFMRLVLIGREIAEGKGINIRRPDAAELLKIRRGEVSLQELFDKSDEILNEMKTLFQNSNLPGEVSEEFIHNMLVEIRTYFYTKVRGFVETADFNRRMISGEEDNVFMQKSYGKFSELQFEMACVTDSHINDVFQGDVKAFIESDDCPFLSIVNANRWPKTKNRKNGRTERLSTENISFIRSKRDMVTIMAGSDDQEPLQFDIVMWQDTAVPIRIKKLKEKDWAEGMGRRIFLQTLGYKI